MEQGRKLREKPMHLFLMNLWKWQEYGEKTVSSISGAGKTGQLHEKMKLEHSLTPYTKINSKGLKS